MISLPIKSIKIITQQHCYWSLLPTSESNPIFLYQFMVRPPVKVHNFDGSNMMFRIFLPLCCEVIVHFLDTFPSEKHPSRPVTKVMSNFCGCMRDSDGLSSYGPMHICTYRVYDCDRYPTRVGPHPTNYNKKYLHCRGRRHTQMVTCKKIKND